MHKLCIQNHCRYAALMFDQPNYEESAVSTVSKRHHKHSKIEYLDVYVYSFDQSLNLDTDESYTLMVRCHSIDHTVRHYKPKAQCTALMHKQVSMQKTYCMHRTYCMPCPDQLAYHGMLTSVQELTANISVADVL